MTLALSIGLAQAKTITADYGGYFGPYWDAVAALNARREQVRIIGHCYSACTMYLGVKRLCIGKNAVLKFHGPDKGPGQKEALQTMMTFYPRWVKRWLEAQGGIKLDPNLIYTMPASYALKYVRECR